MQTIQWQPFSDKHKDYIHNALKCKMSVAEGAVRAGKTIDNCIIAQMILETTSDKIHLASGSTIANAKLNIGDCNGFGLEYLFKGRCKWGKYKDNDALFLKTKTGEKIVIFAGGGKADSYKKILGNSYGLWIATEINEHYDCDNSKESFIKVAMARQLASKNPRILWDLNPSSPRHRIYTDYIDKYARDGLIGGYNYKLFTINDNLSVSKERREEIKSQYDVNSVWYKRDILGQRCVAEGLIYRDFADHPEKYVIKKDDLKRYRIMSIYFGVDYGGNKSANAFVCSGVTYGLREVIVLKSKRIVTKEYENKNGHQLTADILAKMFAEFVKECYNEFRKGGEAYCDSAETILINTFREYFGREDIPAEIYNAKKYDIKERVKLVLKLMSLGKFLVVEDCESVIDALSTAVYNSKEGHEDERLDDGTSDIDSLDALEYSIEPNFYELKRSI